MLGTAAGCLCIALREMLATTGVPGLRRSTSEWAVCGKLQPLVLRSRPVEVGKAMWASVLCAVAGLLATASGSSSSSWVLGTHGSRLECMHAGGRLQTAVCVPQPHAGRWLSTRSNLSTGTVSRDQVPYADLFCALEIRPTTGRRRVICILSPTLRSSKRAWSALHLGQARLPYQLLSLLRCSGDDVFNTEGAFRRGLEAARAAVWELHICGFYTMTPHLQRCCTLHLSDTPPHPCPETLGVAS